MLEVYQRLPKKTDGKHDATVVLTHEERQKARLKVQSHTGEEVRIFLQHGKALQIGDYLLSECGKTLMIEGALEAVTEARCDDWLTFSRACYHLGNRHVKMQVGERWLRLTPDYVLADMLTGLGLTITETHAVFAPENGAYHKHHD